MAVPVMKALASEPRKAAIPSKSPGVPQRPFGVRAMTLSFSAGMSVRALRVSSVSIQPGKMQFTVMPSAAQATANFWYTAWVNAGKPDLSKLDTEYTTKSHEKNLKEELKMLEKGKLVDFSSFQEFPQGK